MLIWVALLLSGVGLATKVTAVGVKAFFVSCVLRVLLSLGTSQTLALLGALNVSKVQKKILTGLNTKI